MRSWLATVQQRMLSITSPAEDGAGAARAMELAMEEAGVQPSEVEYINAHGTVRITENDLFETKAIHKAFGDAAKIWL